ncbi:hypothetical protein HK099_005445 [Clydaea vesicula]|uniref:Fido domain-containing protein n=1 Tax=Clydaea vesicula TaxID=447962 RepID=A0AAD5XYY4_9FUNG|nr:hypothetical protein HK099_005445 [Clydaea vesicula]
MLLVSILDYDEWFNSKYEDIYSDKDIDLIKSGPLFQRYSNLFIDQYHVNDLRNSEINKLKDSVNKLRPLNDTLVQHIEDKLGVILNHSSNVIEGMNITLNQTEKILANKTLSGIKTQDVLDVIGHQRAFNEIINIYRKVNDVITIEQICLINKYVMLNEDRNTGRLRNETNSIVKIGGRKILLPHPQEVPELMKNLIDWLNNININEYNICDLIVNFHIRFITIHPFSDGNGRTARLLCSLISMRHGYGILIISDTKREQYFESIAKWEDDKNFNVFGNLIVDELITCLKIYSKCLRSKCVLI